MCWLLQGKGEIMDMNGSCFALEMVTNENYQQTDICTSTFKTYCPLTCGLCSKYAIYIYVC